MNATNPGGDIVGVKGPAKLAGVRPGDRLLAVNGHRIRDLIDFWFYADEVDAVFEIARDSAKMTLLVQRPEGVPWGIDFAEPLFDGIRLCNNRCPFCFLEQMPRGWRRSLYLRDDDYRLSFLYGNFVTLTNLRQEDWERLEEQRLSPLYVSVHATEPALRRRLLGREETPDICRQLAWLEQLGIVVHAQVVLCPGINDGAHLERTIVDLEQRSRSVWSVALVPVGLTRFRVPPPAGAEGIEGRLRSYTPAEARSLLRWVRPRQRNYRKRWGRTWLYLADEFYLLAQRDKPLTGSVVPAARFYDQFPQLENGVGLVRQLRDDWFRTRGHLPDEVSPPRHVSLVCGTLIAPLLRQIAAELSHRVAGLTADVIAVENALFGPTVTVSGLLTGETLLQVLPGQDLGDLVFLPRAAFEHEGRYTLDDVSVDAVEETLGRPVVLVERMSEVVREIGHRFGRRDV